MIASRAWRGRDVGDQHDEQDEDRATSDVRGDEHGPSIDAVDEDARRRREEDGRHQERQEQQADRGVRAGDVGDHDGQPEEHHVAADLAGHLRQPEGEELAVAQDAADGGIDLDGLADGFERLLRGRCRSDPVPGPTPGATAAPARPRRVPGPRPVRRPPPVRTAARAWAIATARSPFRPVADPARPSGPFTVGRLGGRRRRGRLRRSAPADRRTAAGSVRSRRGLPHDRASQSALEVGPSDEHAATAAVAAQADVRADTDDQPGARAAGMRSSEGDPVAEAHIEHRARGRHGVLSAPWRP